jgi:hypothetical protein
MARFAFAFAICAALAASSLAGDWYVDAIHGDDANSGASPSRAWRTITHALAATPAPPAGETQIVHVAAGTYDASIGEVFPLVLRDAFRIVGDDGRDATFVDAGGTGTVFQGWHDKYQPHYTGPLTLIQGITVQNAARGIDLQSAFGATYLTVRDVRIAAMSDVGLRSSSFCQIACGLVEATLERVEILACDVGVDFRDEIVSTIYDPPMSMTECVVGQCATAGIREYDRGGGAILTVARTKFDANAGDGAVVHQDDSLMGGNTTRASFVDCSFTRNGAKGLRVTLPGAPYHPSTVAVDLARCTVADNAGVGIEAWQPDATPVSMQVSLDSTIVHGNVDDVHENAINPSFTMVAFCDVGDGDFAGSNGNFSADPMFVDAASGDYRLKWSSPCAESGDPASIAGAKDLAGNARPIDGDLDTLEKFDVGAYEFAPLFLASTGELGSTLKLELWGPQGNATTVYFARAALVAPQTTPFGELDLDPSKMSVFRATFVGSGPPKTIVRPIPNDLALVGLTFSFQALTDCAAAPQAKAYTNGVQLTLKL